MQVGLWDFALVFQKHWKFSRWLIGTSLLQWFSGNFFLLAAAGLLSPAAVGAIRILQNIIGVLHVFFLTLENRIPLQAASILQERGTAKLAAFLQRFIWKGALVTAVLAVGIAFFGKPIMQLIYGGEHTQYAYLLYGFAILYILVFVGMGYRFAIRAIENTRIIFIAYVASSAFSLIMAKPLLSHWGIDGVLIGLIATQLIMQGCFHIALNHQKVYLWKSFI